MTLAFTFPIKDAWVIVADKKAVSKFKAESQSDISVFSDSIEKIKGINHNLFFVGSGDEKILSDIIDDAKQYLNFEDFKKYLEIKLKNIFLTITDEQFLVIDKSSQKGFQIRKDKNNKFETKEIKNSVNCKNFIGTFNENTRLGEIKEELTNINNLKFSDMGERFYDFCNRCLGNIAVDNLYCVGHPLVHGSDIWIISKEKIKKISAKPERKYSYTEEVKEDD
ncbi:MAG: hypothetical protein WC812_01965 [Candidatus Pacearchaeota archaeon]|jgi:hypothetical protein